VLFFLAVNKICSLNKYPTFQNTIEYYELCKLDETIPLKKQNPFAPKLPFRLGVADTSESGKTHMVVHLLLGSKYPKIYS